MCSGSLRFLSRFVGSVSVLGLTVRVVSLAMGAALAKNESASGNSGLSSHHRRDSTMLTAQRGTYQRNRG